MAIKTFENLVNEIIEQSLCSLCGACVAVCSANEINALFIEKNKPQHVKDSELLRKCLDCGICYLICGQTSDLNDKLEKLYSAIPPLGFYKFLTCARTTNPEIMAKAQNGGVVTSILKYLLGKNLIDGAIVNKPLENWKSSPYTVTSLEELIHSAGTRYSTVPVVKELGNYKILNKPNPRLAFVGCPCQVKAIRKMQLLNAKPGIYIKYIIGLFCMENFDYKKLFGEKIKNELKIDLNNIKKLNIKGNLFITLKNNEKIEISLKDLSTIVRDNCHYCTYFLNMYADISVGGVGSPPGFSTVLVRTETGNNIFSKLLIENEIKELDKEKLNLTDILSKITKLGQTKYERGIQKRTELSGNDK
ncbi:MAG TPA: Coenzyme F420 hydrogenase/dehydrogenase, beta subunit C-terminal domain [Candidatus Deferrimicrobium sp.]|nr:Coenzyme F420 hydrogenase/dehydrogenase, beta subunit C-terminal domain [Candidatus Deferrimicrobium sp.]